MNTSPDSAQPGGSPGNGFFSWIRGLGITRSEERWFAGVAGGIAAKAGIDPLIVRGIFVVLALLGGPGVLLYLAAWLLLPDTTGKIHAEDIFRGRASGGVIAGAIVLAAIFVLPLIFGITSAGFSIFGVGPWGWDLWGNLGIPGWLTGTIAWLFWIAILVFGFFWLRKVLLDRGRSQADRLPAQDPHASSHHASPSDATPRGAAFTAGPDGTTFAANERPGAPGTAATPPSQEAPTWSAPTGAAGQTAGTPQPSPSFADQTRAFADQVEEQAQLAGKQASDWGKQFGEKATSWSEDVGRQADEWSARYATHHDAHKLGAGQTIVTLALALIAGGGAAAWMSATTDGNSVLIAGLIAGLAVLALSLIVAGIRGKHTGWVGFLATCGVVALLFTAVLPWGTRFQPFGMMEVSPEHDTGAAIIAGTTQVDLSSLDDRIGSAWQGDPSDLEVWQLAGTSTVTLPERAPARVQVRLLAGAVSERGAQSTSVAGPFVVKNFEVNLDRADSKTPVTTTTVYLLAGSVRVNSADGSSSRVDTTAEDPAHEQRDTKRETAERAAEIRSIETQLERVTWKLEEPGITSSERRTLESQQDSLEAEIAQLEKEMAR